MPSSLHNFLVLETKAHLGPNFRLESMSRRVYYKGEGDGFFQVEAMVSLMSSSCPWFVLAPNVFQLCTNHLVLVLCRLIWVSEACQFFLVSSWSSSTPLCPSKVLWTKERAPDSLLFHCFLFGTHILVPQRVGGTSFNISWLSNGNCAKFVHS
jgi:hypothetical protein